MLAKPAAVFFMARRFFLKPPLTCFRFFLPITEPFAEAFVKAIDISETYSSWVCVVWVGVIWVGVLWIGVSSSSNILKNSVFTVASVCDFVATIGVPPSVVEQVWAGYASVDVQHTQLRTAAATARAVCSGEAFKPLAVYAADAAAIATVSTCMTNIISNSAKHPSRRHGVARRRRAMKWSIFMFLDPQERPREEPRGLRHDFEAFQNIGENGHLFRRGQDGF